MRYYDLRIFDPTTGNLVREWTTHPGGKYDPHALLLEFDVPVALQAAPIGQSTLTVYGVPLQDLGQDNRFGLYTDAKGNTQPGHRFQLRGGMLAGLPLANPKQQGVLAEGEILQSWGNWEGTDMTLDLLVNAGGTWASLATPAPIVLNWVAGTELSTALKQCLEFAFPNNTIKIAINAGYVQTHDEIHVCSTLEQLGEWIEQLTRIRFDSPVNIGVKGPTLLVFDESYKPAPVQLAFTDFVGQPTWVKPNEMQVKLVLRGDLAMGGLVQLPQGMQDNPGIVLAAASALPSTIRYKSTFSGLFQIVAMRHIGNSRSADGASWVTIINCIPHA